MINALNRNIFGTGGGASATIYVTGLQESDTVTMVTPSGKVVQGEWGEEQGESVFIFHANEYGMHTITASNGTKISTEEVLVDALMDYWVEMDLTKLYLYKYGDERVSITGGWELFPRTDISYTLPTKGVDSLIFNGNQSIRTVNNINVQNYTKLFFHIVSGKTTNYLSFGLNNGSNFGGATTWWASPIYNQTVTDRTIELFSIANAGDSSLRNVPSRVAMFHNNCTNIVVDAIWLE